MDFEIVVLKSFPLKTSSIWTLDVFSERRALVVKRDHDAQELEVRIRPALDLLDRFEEVVCPLEREVRGLDRNQDVRRSDERVHRDHAERGRRVDEDRVVLPRLAHDLELVLQPEVPVELTEELRLDLRERDAGRRDRELRDAWSA